MKEEKKDMASAIISLVVTIITTATKIITSAVKGVKANAALLSNRLAYMYFLR